MNQKTMQNTAGKNGFTLAELLVVVAIIGVLVTIVVPIFGKLQEKARESVDIANIRSAYAEVMVDAVIEYDGTFEKTIDLVQAESSWQDDTISEALIGLVGEGHIQGQPQKDGKATVIWKNSELNIIFEGPLPVDLDPTRYGNLAYMSERYGLLVEYMLQKIPDSETTQIRSRYSYYGDGETDADKVKIITTQTRDSQTQKEIQGLMSELGYTDAEIDNMYNSLRYAYHDENGKLLGYHGPSAGGHVELYIVGYDGNPISVGSSDIAKGLLAEFKQKGTVTPPQ